MARRKRGRGVDAKGRSKGKGQWVPISYEMAGSLAWRSLSGAAVKVYVELRSRYAPFRNGDLSLSLEEARRLLGLGKATVARAFAELVAKGFLVMTARGHWYGRKATTYAVTDREHGTHPPTNAWRDWRPQKQLLGFAADPSKRHGSGKEPRAKPTRSAGVPVTAAWATAPGTDAEHLYSFTREGGANGSATE